MSDRPVSVEKLGIEHVPEDARHGSARRTFTLWFAANLTIADYAIGVLTTVVFGFTVYQAIPVLLIGNLLGGLVLGLAATMGPTLGFPQMMSSRASFGRRGNYIPGALTWVSTVGWFAVNTILGSEAVLVLAPSANFVVVAAILVLVQVVIATYGHDFIHMYEKVMSIVLGLLFLAIFALTIPHLGVALAYVPPTGGALTFGAVGTLLAVSFSYLMSWSPYASDYSRYLRPSTSKKSILILALAGGAASSFAIEVVGALIGSLTGSLDYFGALSRFAGPYGPLAILAVVLGATAANGLNLYTNALSALVLDVRTKRWVTVLAGGIVGFALAAAFGPTFEAFFENFLLALTYWITPWFAIVLVDFYLTGRATVENSSHPMSFDPSALAIYAFAILFSVPFMVPPAHLGYPVGALSSWFGGADFSYFISFGVAFVLTYVTRRRLASRRL